MLVKAVKSKIAYSTDTWTTQQMIYTFAGTIASFIDDDWQLVERLIDFRHLLDDEHEGVNAAKAFMESGGKRGSLDKISRLAIHPNNLRLTAKILHSPDHGQCDRERCLGANIDRPAHAEVRHPFLA